MALVLENQISRCARIADFIRDGAARLIQKAFYRPLGPWVRWVISQMQSGTPTWERDWQAELRAGPTRPGS